jgi:FkbM family methyltransferase
MTEVSTLYDAQEVNQYVTGAVLSDVDNKEVDFYQNMQWFAGNSVYRENPMHSPLASSIFTEKNIVKKKTITLDTLIETYDFPKPDMIKMDIQGSELDVLKGAQRTLENCTDLILELQIKDYNIGAPKANTVIEYLKTIGFTLVGNVPFNNNGDTDADYHFKRVL